MREMIISCKDRTCFEPEGRETEFDRLFHKRNYMREWKNG